MGLSILVVGCDQEVFRLLWSIFGPEGVAVEWAEEESEALRVMEKIRPQMVISEISFSGVGGLELIRTVQDKFPQTKSVLIADSDIDRHIGQIKGENFGNVLVNGDDLFHPDMQRYLKSLLEQDIFGLQKYFPGQALQKEVVTSYSKAKQVCSRIAALYPGEASVYLEIAVDELISNAVFHGVLQLSDSEREAWCEQHEIAPQDAVSVSWASDREKVGVSVEDSSGNLRKADVLHWFDNSIHDQTRPELQNHGHGLLLIRKLIDRFIINIEPGNRTECMVLQYFEKDHVQSSKALMIQEVKTERNFVIR